MKKYKNHTLKEYLDCLSLRTPVPGGGSAAALTGALGVSLISMVANYSLGKSQHKATEDKIQKIIKESQVIKNRLLELVDLDAQAYLKVAATRKAPAKVKQLAQREAQKVPLEVCRLSYKAIELTPFLVEKGNKYLLSDVVVAVEMLFAAFKAALVLTKEN